MRNFKKLLVVICVLALLTVSCVFVVLANDEAGDIETLNTNIDAAKAETDAVAKYNKIMSVIEYFKTVSKFDTGYEEAKVKVEELTVSGAELLLDGLSAVNVAYSYMLKADTLLEAMELPEETVGYADVKVKYDAALVKALGLLIKDCDANIETTLTTATNGIAVKKVGSLLQFCQPYGDASVLDSLKAEFAVLEEAQEKAEQKNYVALDSVNKVSNYDLPIYYQEDWNERKVGMESSNLGGNWYSQLSGISNKIGIQQEEDGNKFFTHRYLEKKNPLATYAQVGLRSFNVDNTKGLVFEFDVTTFAEMPEQGLLVETGSVNGAYFPPPYFFINGKGDICKNDKSTVVLAGAIVRGEWTHIVVVLEPTEFIYKLYVDGQHICDYEAKYQGARYDHSQVAFRISGGPSTKGEVSIDNIQIYGGDSYRIHDRLEKMSDDEKFLYYVDYLLDEKNAVAERSVAYNTAEALLENYWVVDANGEGTYTDYALEHSEIMDAVDKYVAFDLDAFIYEVGIRNLDSYIALVDKLTAIKRETGTASARKQIVADIYDFVEKNNTLINREIDRDSNTKADFYEYESIVTRISKEATYDANAVDFVRYILRFEKATTLSAKQRNYAKAAELADNDGIDIVLILDESNPDRAKFADLVSAYEVYRNADKVIYELTLSNNSNKIIKCINKINIYTTEEEWIANREEMEYYLFLLKDIVLNPDDNGNLKYDPEVEGIKEAIDFFDKSYGFFYSLLQTEHVNYIQSVLDRIAATDAYIEKMGMVSMLEKYIATNDINYKDARISDLINDLDTCKAELKLREADYAKILVQNAVYFTNLVERMRTAETYNEQKAYFEDAYLLYFNIDITVEGAARAVEIFDEYKIKLDRIAESSVKFIEAVAIYKACETEEDKYAALVECYYNAQFVEMSYDGAEEAMAEYTAAYNDYMNYVEAVNNDITATGNAIGSLRVPCGISNIIAIILKKLFGI